jgi:hypothetical protein
LYYAGKDVLGNKFKDHQLPKKNNSWLLNRQGV